jgi:SulP family sulfate permease
MASYFKTLKPNPKTIASDAASGFATGLFSIPEGMAYASLAGVNPVYGLYSGMVSTIAAAMTTGTILMISTLTSAIALATASVISEAGLTGDNVTALFTITFLVGATMFILGILRLGSLVNYVSNAVMTGFVMGASLLIIIGELGDLTGYEPVGANDVAEVFNWITNISSWDSTTTIVGVATIILMVVFKMIPQTEKMGAIITLILGSVVVYVLNLDIALVGPIQGGLPAPTLPDFSMIPELALGSVSVALVALVQGAGISTAVPNPDGSKSSASRDFLGQGIGNLAGSFFQSMPTGGSLSRTGISTSAGAKSRWGGIFAGVFLAIIIVLFYNAVQYVPMAVIGGMLCVIGTELVLGRVPDAKLIIKTSWGATAAGAITLVSALFIPLQYTIFLGAGLSLILYIYASSKELKVRRLVSNEENRYEERDLPEVYPSNEVTIIAVSGAEFYADVPTLDDTLPSTLGVTNAVVIFRLRGREGAGSTGLKWLSKYTKKLHTGGNQLMLAGISPGVMKLLEHTGVIDVVGRENVFTAQPGFGASLDAAQAAAQQWLSEQPSKQAADDDSD